MARPPVVPRPPEVGVDAPAPRIRDVVRMVWWVERGLLHSVRKGPWSPRILSLVLALTWWPMAPALVLLQLVLVYGRQRTTRYYMSPERDASIGINATRKGWHISDHSSARPGTGKGRALRSALIPELLSAADNLGVDIVTTAATSALADRYRTDLPDLVDEGRGWPRGRRLRRPSNTAQTDL